MRISDWSSDVCSSDLHNHKQDNAQPHDEACATLRGQSECGHQSNDKQHADYCTIQAYNHLDHNFPFAGKHINQAAFPQLAANDRITRQATLTIFRPPLCFWLERSTVRISTEETQS